MTRRFRWRGLTALALSVFTAGTLAACTAPSAAQATGATSDTLRVGVVGPTLVSIDPNTTLRTGSESIVWSVYSRLTSLDNNGQVKPDLATSWKQASTNSWTFTLRSGVTYSNGTPLTADTVVWNLQRDIDPSNADSPALNWRKQIADVVKVNDTQVRIDTKTPLLALPKDLATVFFLDPTWAKSHNPATEALGSGPYELQSYTPEQQAVLVRNPSYKGTAPAFAKVIVIGYADEATRLTALKNHEIDATLTIDPSNLSSLKGVSGLVVGGETGQRVQTLQLNFNRVPFQDIRVRQALNYAIDRDSITKSIYSGTTSASRTQVISKYYVGYDSGAAVWPYDLDKARQLLAEAGYANGFTVNVNVPSQTYAGAEQAIQIIKQEWAQLKVTLNVQVLPSGPWSDQNLTTDVSKAPDIIYWGIQNPNLDPVQNLLSWTTGYRTNDGALPNQSEYDNLVSQAATASTNTDLVSDIQQASAWLRNNAALIYL